MMLLYKLSNCNIFISERVLRYATISSEEWCDLMGSLHKLEEKMDCFLMKKHANLNLDKQLHGLLISSCILFLL